MQPQSEITLYTPGPVTVPQRILAAGAMAMIHHRSPAFHELYSACMHDMQWLLGTSQDVLMTHTSGRGAMEGCISNLLCAGDQVASVVNGNFGAMYGKIATAYGLKVHQVLTDWAKPFAGDAAAAELEAVLTANPGIKAITICHNDTSNSVENDNRLASTIARKPGVLLLVDAVSSAGCMPIEFDAWDIDALVTASQKGLMSPAGVAFVALSDRAWKAAESSNLPRYFTNFKDIRKKFHEKPGAPETPGSTPVSLVRCVTEALAMIREEGRDQVFARHARLAAAVRAGITGMGMDLVPANQASPSASVTTFYFPQGVNAGAIRSALVNSFRMQIAGGLGQYKDSTLRIGHMGYFYDASAISVIGALETVLYRLGAVAQPGAGIAACMKAL